MGPVGHEDPATSLVARHPIQPLDKAMRASRHDEVERLTPICKVHGPLISSPKWGPIFIRVPQNSLEALKKGGPNLENQIPYCKPYTLNPPASLRAWPLLGGCAWLLHVEAPGLPPDAIGRGTSGFS